MSMGFGTRSIGRVIDDAIAMYRAHFKTYATAALWIIFPAMLLQLAASSVYNYVYMDSVMSMSAASEEEAAAFLVSFIALYGVLLVGIAAAGLARAYYASSVYSSAEVMLFGQRSTPGEFLKAGRERWLAYLGATIVVGIILYGVVTVASMIGTFIICLLPAVLIGSVVGSLYFWARFSMIGPTVVVERASLSAAFTRSASLVRGNEWRTVGFLVMMALINSVLQQAISSITFIPLIVSIVQNPDAVWATGGFGAPGMVWLTVVTGLINAIALSITVPLTSIATYSYYLDLRSRCEGMDLLMRARTLRGVA
ncbi:MAG: hypothetical protein Q7W51_00465 [Coriobacteriia bacterium]|nr:hypothetical protein [Coriobacteriia bacterium]